MTIFLQRRQMTLSIFEAECLSAVVDLGGERRLAISLQRVRSDPYLVSQYGMRVTVRSDQLKRFFP